MLLNCGVGKDFKVPWTVCMGSIVVAFLVADMGSRVYGLQQLQHVASAVVAPGL